MNKLQWNLNRNSSIFFEENTFENVVCEMLSISPGSQCVNSIQVEMCLRKCKTQLERVKTTSMDYEVYKQPTMLNERGGKINLKRRQLYISKLHTTICLLPNYRIFYRGCFTLCDWLSMRCLGPWINHLPPVCCSIFRKSILNRLACNFNRM